FTAIDADNDRDGDSLEKTIIVWIEITDDDTTAPVITYIYTGDYTDENPGELIITASDNIELSVDPSGTYLVPNSIGIHEFVFTAIDADNDRDGDSLEKTIIVWI
ncbi:MAG: hypothetical protein ACW99E_17125, partial [Promethearchaeota archaeon]